MIQHSLLDNNAVLLAGLMPALRASMRKVAGLPDSEGRKLLVDKINKIANEAEVKLTGGNVKNISKDTLDKWLSPSDTSHPPSVLAVIVFCMAAGNTEPIEILLRALNLEIMSHKDKKARDYGKAILDEKAARTRRKRLEQNME